MGHNSSIRTGVRIGFGLLLIPFTLYVLGLLGFYPDLMRAFIVLFFAAFWAGFILLMLWHGFAWLTRNAEEHDKLP